MVYLENTVTTIRIDARGSPGSLLYCTVYVTIATVNGHASNKPRFPIRAPYSWVLNHGPIFHFDIRDESSFAEAAPARCFENRLCSSVTACTYCTSDKHATPCSGRAPPTDLIKM